MRYRWLSFVAALVLLTSSISLSSAKAQQAPDAADVVILVDRSGSTPGPEARSQMLEMLTLWTALVGPQDRVRILRVGGVPRWVTSNWLSIRQLPDGRSSLLQNLNRLGDFEGKDANWERAVDQAIRELEKLPNPASYQALLALVREDPETPQGEARLEAAAARLHGPPLRPFYGLSLEGGVTRINRSLGARSGGWVGTALTEGMAAGLQMAATLSPHRWVTRISLQPGKERTLSLPPQTRWVAFVLFRPTPSARLIHLTRQGEDWLSPAARPRIDHVNTERMEILSMRDPGNYGGEWQIRIGGDREATLGILIGLSDPLLPIAPGTGRRWIAPAEAPLYVEARIPSLPQGAELTLTIDEERIPIDDEGGMGDREAGDGQGGGISGESSWESGLRPGSFRLRWEGVEWEQPVWIEFRSDLPTLRAQIPSSPTLGVPISIAVERPAGVEEVTWRWVGWRMGNSDWQSPEQAQATETGWEWRIGPRSSGNVRFLGLAEIRVLQDGASLVYPQAVVADFPVLSPTEGQVLVGLEKRPDRLQVPGQLTLVITSTLNRPAEIQVDVEDPQGSIRVLPSAFRIPAREVIRQPLELRGEVEKSRTIRLRLREGRGAPVRGGEISLTIERASSGSPLAIVFCLLVPLAGGGFLILRHVWTRRSMESWS